MDRDVGRVDDQFTRGIEDPAREIEALLDVRRDGRALQGGAHLPRDAFEPVGEELDTDRGGALQGGCRFWPPRAMQAMCAKDCAPTPLDHGRAVAREYHRGAGDPCPGAQGILIIRGNRLPMPGKVCPPGAGRFWGVIRRGPVPRADRCRPG